MLDRATIEHLDAWLSKEMAHMAWQDVLNLRDIIIRVASANPDWLDRGWWKLFDYLSRNRR